MLFGLLLVASVLSLCLILAICYSSYREHFTFNDSNSILSTYERIVIVATWILYTFMGLATSTFIIAYSVAKCNNCSVQTYATSIAIFCIYLIILIFFTVMMRLKIMYGSNITSISDFLLKIYSLKHGRAPTVTAPVTRNSELNMRSTQRVSEDLQITEQVTRNMPSTIVSFYLFDLIYIG